MAGFNLVFSANYQAQFQRLSDRYKNIQSVQSAIEFGLRRDPYTNAAMDKDGYGVAFTQPFSDVPALRIAYRVATKTVTLLAIEPDA